MLPLTYVAALGALAPGAFSSTASSMDTSVSLLQGRLRIQSQAGAKALCKTSSSGQSLTEEDLRIALSLGRDYMLGSLRPSGEFLYQFDWKRGRETRDTDYGDLVNPVREACGLWGLSLMVLDTERGGNEGTAKLLEGLRKSLNFFDHHTRLFNDGRRIVVYPGLEQVPGKTGTLAVVALAIIDYLRTPLPDHSEKKRRMESLQGLLKSLKLSIRKDGRVHRKYRNRDGVFYREHSPHFDGEVLLAFVKAAKYLELTEYWPTVKLMVTSGWNKNVKDGLKAGKDTENLKAYYQWSSMAWYELLNSGKAKQYADFGPRLIDYAMWMVKVHHVGRRTRNTGYAFEGLIPAYLVAERLGRKHAMHVLGCAIDKGMRRVSSMQLGHPLAAGLAKHARLSNRTRGGVQDAFKQPMLRIDTTEHQMHSAILARRLLQRQELI